MTEATYCPVFLYDGDTAAWVKVQNEAASVGATGVYVDGAGFAVAPGDLVHVELSDGARVIGYASATGIDGVTVAGLACDWFAMCTNPAATMMILPWGPVPICARCKARVDAAGGGE